MMGVWLVCLVSVSDDDGCLASVVSFATMMGVWLVCFYDGCLVSIHYDGCLVSVMMIFIWPL